MQVTLRVWHGMGRPTGTPIQATTCGNQALLDGLGFRLSAAPLGKEVVGATPLLTHQQTAPHPNQSSRPWPSLLDKRMAGISHGSHPILWVSRTAREGWLLIRATVPLPEEQHHHSVLGD